MKQLPTNYRKNGYNHEVVYRENDLIISKMTSIESGRFLCYEVFKVKIQKPGDFFKTLTEEVEGTPSNEDWGNTGFSVHTLTEALKKIEWLKQPRKKGRPKTGNSGIIQKQVP